MKQEHRKDYVRGGFMFVECALCGRRYNAGRGGNGAGVRWCNALKNDWWAKHTGQESPEVVHCADSVELCPILPKGVEEARAAFKVTPGDRYQVITYGDGGADEKLEYRDIEAADRAARGYIDGSEPLADGLRYEGAIVYDLKERRIVREYGYFPSGARPIEGDKPEATP